MAKIECGTYKILFPLLDALHWQGSNAKVIQSLAGEKEHLDLNGLLETMSNLSYRHQNLGVIKGIHMDPRSVPILVVNGKQMLLVVNINEKFCLVYDNMECSFKEVPTESVRGSGYGFQYAGDNQDSLLTKQNNWFGKMILRFKKSFAQVAALTCMMTFLDLLIPLFIVLIYSQIGSGSNVDDLIILFAGILLYFGASTILAAYRSSIINYISVRLGAIISTQTYRRLMYLSPGYTETASVSSQINRIKDFENLKRFTNSGIFTSIIETVFSVIYVLAIFIFGGWLGVVPIVTAIVVICIGLVFRPIHKMYMERTSEANSVRQKNTIEILHYANEIKSTGMAEHFISRSRNMVAKHIYHSYRQSDFVNMTNGLNHFITNGSVLVVIYGGVLKVFEGKLSMGMLIGIILIYWKILASVRSSFSLSVQVNGLMKSIKQINRFMKLPLDNQMKSNQVTPKPLKGNVRLQDISIRYNQNSKPALMNVNLNVKAGEIIGITGHDGAGKTTILKLILGMYKPQGGRITLDNMNIKQLEPIALRQSISYSPERDMVFEGTIRDNFTVINPLINDDHIRDAVTQTGFMDYMIRYNLNLDSHIDNKMVREMPGAFSKTLSLARMLCRDVKLYLLDEPEKHLDPGELDRICQIIIELSLYQNATVIISTKDSRLLECCNRIVRLNQGRMRQAV